MKAILASLAAGWMLSLLGCQSCRPEATPAAPPQISAVSEGMAVPSVTAAPSALAPRIPSTCVTLREEVAKLGPYEQWSRRFDGSPDAGDPRLSPRADKGPLPQLGTLADLPSVPRSRLAYVRSGDILVTEIPGGGEAPILGGGDDDTPTWSPAGTYLAFTRKGRDKLAHGRHVYVVRAEGGTPERISVSEPVSGVAFSADERWLAFAATSHEIVVHDLQTGAERLVPADPVDFVRVGPVFDPGGSRLVYMDRRQVVVVDAATGQERRYDPIDDPQSIAFTPGKLLIATTPDPSVPQTTVRAFDLETGKDTFAFVPGFTGDASVYLVGAPKGGKVATYIGSPAWAGETLGNWHRSSVFVELPARLRVSDAFPQPIFSMSAPAWAPDGRHLAFVVSLQRELNDSHPEAEAIVAVDTDAPRGRPVEIACGHDPAWGPIKAP